MRQVALSSWYLIGVILLTSAACSPVPYGNLVARAAPPAEEEFLLTLGPIDLAPDLDHFDAPQPLPLHATFPRDGWARGFQIELVDASGEAVPFEVLHHVKVIVPGKRELLQPISLRLVGAGSETRSGRLADGLGIPVLRGDSILATAMVQPFFLHATPPGSRATTTSPLDTRNRAGKRTRRWKRVSWPWERTCIAIGSTRDSRMPPPVGRSGARRRNSTRKGHSSGHR